MCVRAHTGIYVHCGSACAHACARVGLRGLLMSSSGMWSTFFEAESLSTQAILSSPRYPPASASPAYFYVRAED